jgi:hypothetical protein
LSVKQTKVEKFLALLPEKVKVGPYNWTLLVTDKMAQTENEIESGKAKPWGQTQPVNLTIKLLPHIPSTEFAVGVLIHELYHAGLYSSGMKHPKKEEEGALTVEAMYTSIFSNNIWLLDWMKKGLK